MASVFDVARAFLIIDSDNDGDGISNLKLQKLVYYAQGFYLAIFDTNLFEEDLQAWTHGPVSPDLYHRYKVYGNSSISEKTEMFELSKQELELVEEVYSVFGQFSAWKLRNMTHEEKPWLDNEADADLIPKKELSSYFKTRIN